MYKVIALLQKPLISGEDLISIFEDICNKLNFSYQGYKMGEYGSKKDGFIPLYCFEVKYKCEKFKIVYQEGLGSFQTANTLDFKISDYKAKIEISSVTKDTGMDYLNPFILLCENIEKAVTCILVQFNPDKKQWEKIA